MTAEPNLELWNHGGPPDPAQLMHVVAECWPFAADEQGIWLLSGDYPLSTDPLAADANGFDDIKLELIRNQMLADTAVLHGTSTRPEGPSGVWTFVAVVDCDGPIRLRWPDALPMSPRAAAYVGKPPTHGAADPPVVRHWDVVTHCLRHLAFQLTPWGDAEQAAKLDGNWRRHLELWTPALAQMYDRVHESA